MGTATTRFPVFNRKALLHVRHSQADATSRCHNMRAYVAELEQAIFQTLKKQLDVVLTFGDDGTIRLGAVVAERSEYEKQIKALYDSKQALFEQYIMGELDMEAYKAQKAAYDATILKTKNAYAAVAAQAKQKQEEQDRQTNRQEVAKAITDAEGLTPELTDLLIEKVYVFPDNRIEIAYKV